MNQHKNTLYNNFFTSSTEIPNDNILLDSINIPFEGPEARYFKNVVISDDNAQPFRHCKTMRNFLQKINEIKTIRKIGYGITVDKMNWFLYALSNKLYKYNVLRGVCKRNK